MTAAVVALVIWVAAAFAPDGSTHYGAFEDEASCKEAIAKARAAGVFTTDCAKVELSKPKNGASS